MRKYLFLLLALILIVVGPALAVNLTAINPRVQRIEPVEVGPGFYYDADSQNLVIARSSFTVMPGESLSYSYVFDDGSSIGGSVTVNYLDESMSLGSESSSWSAIHVPGVASLYVVTLTVDSETDPPQYYLTMFRERAIQIGVDPYSYDNPAVTTRSDHIASQALSATPSTNPPIGLRINSGHSSALAVFLSTIQDLYTQEDIAANLGQGFIDTILSGLALIYDYFLFFWEVLLFLINNWMLIFLLIEGGMLAYTMNDSRNIFEFFQKAIENNKRLIYGAVGFVQMLITLIGELIQLINPMRYIMGR